MPNPRRKGSAGEREWTAYLRSLGIQARRVPLSGAAPGYGGDVDSLIPGLGRVVWQVKRRRSFPDWLGIEGADAVAFRADRGRWYVLLPVGLWQALLCTRSDDGRGS
jgi:hypothetical protein